MREYETNKVLKPQKKQPLIILLFFIFLVIAAACISAPFYIKYEKTKDPQNFSELVQAGAEEEGAYAELHIAYLPELLAVEPEGNNAFYYVTDEADHVYIARISEKTYEHLNEICDKETGKLNAVYALKGFTYGIDDQIRGLVLYDNSYGDSQMFEEHVLNEDNFSQYLGEVYIDESRFPVSDRTVTWYKIIALIGVFFLIMAVGYLLPAMIKARKLSCNQDLTDELKAELAGMKESPYAANNLYLTRKYIVSGLEIVKYEDVIWGYVEFPTQYMIKTGRQLIVYTKDKKRHTIVSVSPKNTLPDIVLSELQDKIPQMKVGYNKENEIFFKNYKKE